MEVLCHCVIDCIELFGQFRSSNPDHPNGSMLQRPNPRLYRLPCPAGAFFLSFGLCEPRGSVLLAIGGRFLRAARFSFLRSCLSWIFVVSMSAVLFSYTSEVGAAFVVARLVLQCCPLFPTETVAVAM